MKKFDVVIVGAGIIGLNIAWQIARRSKQKVAVIEKGAGVGEGSTGASSAVCRHRYTLDEVVQLARDGIDAYRNWAAYTNLESPRAGLHEHGVLWMPGSDRAWADREHERMRRFGIPTEVLDDADLNARFPSLSTCALAPDVETGADHECEHDTRSLLETSGGYADPVSAAQDLVDACRARDVDVLFKTRVDGIGICGGRVQSVVLGDGERIETPLLINAAGPWCRGLYEKAGIDLSWDLAPVRIQVLYRDRPDTLDGHIPVTVDMPGGIYFRTQNRGQQLVVSTVLEQDEQEVVENPDRFEREPDDDFQLQKLHALHHRLPALPYRGKVRGYCGLYTMNRDDVHPILGPTDIDGFWVANGFSGHGFKLAPAIGSMLARAITGESLDFDTDVPLSFLAVGRAPIRLDSKSVLA